MRLTAALLATSLAGCTTLPPTQTLQLGVQRIAYVQAGTGRPAVVLQSGLGDGKAVWAGVIARAAPAMALFAYDRPGYGQSGSVPAAGAGPAPRDPCTVARELHETLRAAGVAPPYVLVGHSIGGLYQYAFAKLYPAEVAAVLLLDPTHPEHWARMQREAPAAAGLASAMRSTAFAPAMRAEFDDQALPACMTALKAAPATSMPVRLLVRSHFGIGETEAFQALVRRLEADWPALLPGATRRQVAGAGHDIPTDRPDVVVEELHALVTRVSRQNP